MRTMLLLVLCTLLSALPVLAADDSATYPQAGLEFGLPSNVGLDDFGLEEVDGYDVSWTKRTGPTRGWRFGTTVHLLDDGDSSGGVSRYADYSVVDDNDYDRSSLTFALRAQKLFLTEPRHGVACVLGVGPTLGYAYYNRKDNQNRHYVPVDPDDTSLPDDSLQSAHTTRHSFHGGATVDLGFDWRVARQVSVGGRYQWGLIYAHEETDSQTSYVQGDFERTSDSGQSGDSFSLTSDSIDLVATFWF